MPYLGAEPTAHHGLISYKYVAAGGSQTTFTGADSAGLTLSYDIGNGSCAVWLNGIKLDRSDITASNGTSVVLAACTDGDIIEIQAVKALTVGDVVPASTGGTFASAVTMTSPLAVASGGTGAATHSANGVLLGAGTGAVTTAAPSTSGNVLTSNGTVWASATPAAGATGIVAVSHNLTTASGSLAVTGFGFQPVSIIVHGIVGAADNVWSYGIAKDGVSLALSSIFGVGTVSADRSDNHTVIWRMQIDGSNYSEATISSWDTDGFTFAVTKTGSPTGYAKLLITGFKS